MDGWVLVGRMVVRVLFVFSEACLRLAGIRLETSYIYTIQIS